MKDTTVFEGKNFSDLLKDICDATLIKRVRIDELITELRNLIQKPDDAVIIAPIIKGYLEVMISNDEHIVKVATIVQRIIAVEANTKTGNGLDDLLSDSEKESLLKDAIKELDEATSKLVEVTVPATP